jgi:hypothetical protein
MGSVASLFVFQKMLKQNNEIHKKRIRNKNCLVCKRLFDHSRITRKDIREYEENNKTIYKAKLKDKLQKIRFSISEKEIIPWIHYKHRKKAKIQDFLLKKDL